MLSLLLSILFVSVSARIDKEVLEYSYIYSHTSRTLQRVVFFATLGLYSITGALGGALIFAALFDAILNKLRGLEVLHLGTTAKWDKFFNDRLLLYICVKVISLGLGIYLCLI